MMAYFKRALIVFFIMLVIGESYAQNSQIQQMVYSIDGLTDTEKEQLSSKLEAQFRPLLEKQSLDNDILKSITGIVSAGIFEQASFDAIAEIAVKAYQSEINGASSKYVEDLALIGFSYPITREQLEMASKSIERLIAAGIEPLIIEELISYSIYNGWNGNTIYTVCKGLLMGNAKGLDVRKLTLTFIIGVDQQIDKKNIDEIVNESIQYLKTITDQPREESNRKRIAFQYLQTALTNGVPRYIGEEIYYIAINEKWSGEAITAVFKGIIEGHKLGVTTEKLATALIIRMAQGLRNIKPQQMVEQELKYITQLEKKRLELIKADNKKYKRELKPINQYQLSYIQPEKPEKKLTKPPVTYYPTTARKTINEQLMWQTIREFLGPPPTPYRWGGTSRRGIDCSGLTQAIYWAQGIYIPRNSRHQFQVGLNVHDQLKFGDLIFFSKYFNNYVTHVGIYIGNGNFVHASCTKGVTISSLNHRYYRARYRGAKRIVY